MSALPCYLMTSAERTEANRRAWRERGQLRRARISAAARLAMLNAVSFESIELTPSHRWWLERFSLAEICELGGGLLLFAVDEDVAA